MLSPPVDLTPGWQAIISWLVSIINRQRGSGSCSRSRRWRCSSRSLSPRSRVTSASPTARANSGERHRGARALRDQARPVVERAAARGRRASAARPYELRKLAGASAPHRDDHGRASRSCHQTEASCSRIPRSARRPNRNDPKTVPIDRSAGSRAVRVSGVQASRRGGLQIQPGHWRHSVCSTSTTAEWWLPAFNDTPIDGHPEKSGVI